MEGRKLAIPANPSTRMCCQMNWNNAKAIDTNEKMRPATLFFEQFKAPYMDGIYLVALTEAIEHSERFLRNVFL